MNDEILKNLPEKAAGSPHRVFSHLLKHNISRETIAMILAQGLAYQAVDHNNIVFVNYGKTAAEIKASNDFKKFSQVRRVSPDKFWYMGKKGDTVYICTSAMECLSLYELLNHEKAIYASMAGALNYQIIDKIIASGKNVILALGNDPTSERCRQKYPDLETMIPSAKSWQEDLTAISVDYGGIFDMM